MNAIELISQDLFDKVRSRFSNLELGDENGNVTTDPRAARFFDFNFAINGNNLGRVSISINERGTLKIFYGQGILDESDPITQEMWFDFLKNMRNFAKRRMLRYDTRDLTKTNLKKGDFQYLASTGSKEDNMKESKMFGSSKSSYLPLDNTRLIVRHSKQVDENMRGSRSRNIESIFIENSDGERFRYPYAHLAGAKAMQRHIANGGSLYDPHGMAIVKVSEQIKQLTAFKRNVNTDAIQEDAVQIVDCVSAKLNSLKSHLTGLSKQKYYEGWRNNANALSAKSYSLDAATLEDYKSKFTVSSFSENLEQYFPLIHDIMNEAGTIELADYIQETQETGEFTVCNKCKSIVCKCNSLKEFRVFESWVRSVNENKIEPDVLDSLKELVSDDMSLGVDAIDAIQSLKGAGVDAPELFSALKQLANLNSEADPLPTVEAWLEKFDPDAAEELKNGNDKEGQGLTPADDEEEPADAQAGPETEPEEPPQGEQPPSNDVPVPPSNGLPAPAGPEEGMTGSVVGGVAGAALTKTPGGAVTGAQIGSKIQDMLPEGVSLLNVAEMVKSFYDRETKKFPLGKTGVVTKIRKELGDKAAELAERLIDNLSAIPSKGKRDSNPPKSNGETTLYGESVDSLPSILKLAGLQK